MALAELLSDTKALIKTYSDRSPNDAFDARAELSDNVLPLLEAMLEEITKKDDERDQYIGELGEMVDQLVDDSEVLQPETTRQVLAVFELGKLLAGELDAAMPKLDDVAKKRITKQVKAYRAAVQELAPVLIEITLDDEEEDEPAQAPGAPPVIGDPVEDDDEYEDEDEDESTGG